MRYYIIRCIHEHDWCEVHSDGAFRWRGADGAGADRGRWETAPIVSPYIKFNNGAKFEFPLGDLLKEIILRRQDHQREFRPHPLTHPQ